MIRSPSAVAAALIAASVSFSQPVFSQEETDQRFGTVHFATSCNETAQRRFDRAMRYQHSFWYRESKEIFEEVAQGRSRLRDRLLGHRAEPAQQPACPAAGRQPSARPCRHPEGQGGRRQDATRARFHRCAGRVLHRLRQDRPWRARAGLSQGHGRRGAALSDDDEAQIFYAITLNVAASPSDKTYANQLKGAAILEPIFKRQPRHPGVAHYLIHLYDTPALAEKGLDAAKRYAADRAGSAARAAHAVPHLHARRLLEGIDRLQHRLRAGGKGRQGVHDQLHAMDYMVYAYLQLGQDAKAQAVVEEMNAVSGFNPRRSRRAVCAGREPGALRGGTRRLEGRGGAAVQAEHRSPMPKR